MQEINDILEKIHYEILLKKNTTSKAIITKNYMLFFINTICIKQKKLSKHTRKFIFTDENIYEFTHQELENTTLTYLDFYDILKNIFENYDKAIEIYLDIVEKKEDELYKKNISPLFLNNWFDIKSDLTKIEHVLSRLEHAFLQIQKYQYNLPNISYYLEEVSTKNHDCEYIIKKLDNLYNYFYSLKNEKMNKQIFIITIVSLVFLPINLLVGFFGMNTQNLFFDKNPNGTLYVLYIILCISIGVFSIFLIKKILNHFILNKKHLKLKSKKK